MSEFYFAVCGITVKKERFLEFRGGLFLITNSMKHYAY